jgi:hypothetical protein
LKSVHRIHHHLRNAASHTAQFMNIVGGAGVLACLAEMTINFFEEVVVDHLASFQGGICPDSHFSRKNRFHAMNGATPFNGRAVA